MTSAPALPARYADLARIGRGGMAQVWSATDTVLRRPVAVKVLAPDLAEDERARARFLLEARAAARIVNPHVVLVFDVGETHEPHPRPYLVMERVDGVTLAECRDRARGDAPRIARWITQAAEGIAAGHAAGVVHRDVTPRNLLLTPDDVVKVADFGIARVLDALDGVTATQTGTLLGSVGYIAPEVLDGNRAGPEADVYALAVVAYELLTGGRPFAPREPAAEMLATATLDPPPPSIQAPNVSRRVDAVFARALARDPGRRFRSAPAFAAALAEALAGPTEPTRVMAAPGPRRTQGARSARRPVLLAVVVVLALAAAGAALALAMRDDGSPGAAAGATTAAAPPAQTVTRRVTTPAPEPEVRTVTREVTAPAPAPAPAPTQPTTTQAPPATTERSAPITDVAAARRATDAAWGRIEAGDPSGALALQEPALPVLVAAGDAYEGNAAYNMGRALMDLGRCDEAVGYLEQAARVHGTEWQNGQRKQARAAARECRKR